tara:strand:+ start:48 stop:512 length:465 start_codon:yes stop_codon:yes gene_type:complete
VIDRRAKFREGLHELYLPIYDKLCEILSEDWQPYYGLRTFENQAALYAQGRTLPGAIVTDAKPGESAHNYGCASDWCLWVGNKPVWPAVGDIFWIEFSRAVVVSGGDWGGHFYKPDCPHVQLSLKVSWKSVGEIYAAKGSDAADQYIRDNFKGA